MFDGRDYKKEFDEACDSLVLENDPAQVQSTLLGIEWVLGEAICGVFIIQATLLTSMLMFAVGWLIGFNSMDWLAKSIFGIVCFATFLSIYWISKFALWYEISRHQKPRRFGDPFQK